MKTRKRIKLLNTQLSTVRKKRCVTLETFFNFSKLENSKEIKLTDENFPLTQRNKIKGTFQFTSGVCLSPS